MVVTSAVDAFQDRTTRLALWLTLTHTVPVVWLTPVAGGTAPVVALLAVGVAGLISFDDEGLAMGLMALLPALVYTGLAWAVAWLAGRGIRRLPRPAGLVLLPALVGGLLITPYFPIYVTGGHSGSTSATLFELVEGALSPSALAAYWVSAQLLIGALVALQFVPVEARVIPRLVGWTPRVLRASAVLFAAVLVWVNVTGVVCRPLAYLGLDRAQLCVAGAGGADARYWYEQAGSDGNAEALAWLIDNTPNRSRRLEWLRLGARAGVPEVQYELYRHLTRHGGGDPGEAERWLAAAVAAGHAPALMVQVDRLTDEIRRTGSKARLAERRTLLEAAARNGSRAARLRLAEHHVQGSMGYPVDVGRARRYYGSATDGIGKEDTPAIQVTTIVEGVPPPGLSQWLAAAESDDPTAQKALARLWLTSELPGPGVRERGLALFERLAETDPEIRRELIMLLRTGAGGAEKDPVRARAWLLRSAREGDVSAMQQVADDTLNGREGFVRDYPEARRWIEALIDHHRRMGGPDSERRLAALEAQLHYLNRLADLAGGELLGAEDLDALAGRTDAESLYRYGLQRLAAGGAESRAEAITRLQAAADLGHAGASWRLVQIYERGMPGELDPASARRELERAAALHHFEATRELASRHEYGKGGYEQDLPRAIDMYEAALAAGRDDRYGWNLSPEVFEHLPWLESRLRQARLKQAEALATTR